jgi:hypothetical protein
MPKYFGKNFENGSRRSYFRTIGAGNKRDISLFGSELRQSRMSHRTTSPNAVTEAATVFGCLALNPGSISRWNTRILVMTDEVAIGQRTTTPSPVFSTSTYSRIRAKAFCLVPARVEPRHLSTSAETIVSLVLIGCLDQLWHRLQKTRLITAQRIPLHISQGGTQRRHLSLERQH